MDLTSLPRFTKPDPQPRTAFVQVPLDQRVYRKETFLAEFSSSVPGYHSPAIQTCFFLIILRAPVFQPTRTQRAGVISPKPAEFVLALCGTRYNSMRGYSPCFIFSAKSAAVAWRCLSTAPAARCRRRSPGTFPSICSRSRWLHVEQANRSAESSFSLVGVIVESVLLLPCACAKKLADIWRLLFGAGSRALAINFVIHPKRRSNSEHSFVLQAG